MLDFDLFANVGGGQSVYQRLIALHPQDTFYYLRLREAAGGQRPANAVAVPFTAFYHGHRLRLPAETGHFFSVYVYCRNIAASLRAVLGPIDFDVVDAPDYNQLALFIRPALQAEGMRVATVALALHGTLSMALGAGWPSGEDDGPALAELRAREQLQFRAADTRYAISATYAAEWRRYADLPVQQLDPLSIIGEFTPMLPPPSTAAPDLAFVGRREKWKGPDLFLDLAWCLNRDSYRRLLLIGPDGPNRLGDGSTEILVGMARLRGLAPEITGGWPRSAVAELFEGRSLLLLPSRHDTFNLTALEAIARGCPAIISRRAGVAFWIEKRIPQLGWLITDIECSRVAAAHTEAILRDYDACRARLVDAVSRFRQTGDPEGLASIYRSAARQDVAARQSTVELAAHFALQVGVRTSSPTRRAARAALAPATRIGQRSIAHLPLPLQRRLGTFRRHATALWRLRRRGALHWEAKEALKAGLRRTTGLSPRSVVQIVSLRDARAIRRRIVHDAEHSVHDVAAKIAYLSREVPNHLGDRVRLLRELARLERRAGRDLVAATYGLRLMRWHGRDVYGDLPFVCATLAAQGFVQEAETAAAMFGAGADAFDRCLDLMQGAYTRHRRKPDLPLAVLDDRRGETMPRAAVIVSLYNAAEKLPTLLAMLQRQSLAARGELEIILIDSNSPGDERGAFAAFARQHDLPIVYARSAARETIQAAWNRGIKLARAPYLAFLGADEGLHPDALRRLAEALDGDPTADWAIADSLVTSVDRRGVFDADVMPYDRRGYRQDLVYLETCYLSWVGGLYRRSIHDRFGWYDESFTAAGDTEFKFRILPKIRSVHVPEMLGVFNNYPEARTTQHPRAEIEDLRAWYLWRSAAGMHYAFARRPAEDAARLLQDSLNYRKSFCAHLSTDFDLADALAEYLATRPDAPDWAQQAQRQTAAALSLLRDIELVPAGAAFGPGGVLRSLWLYRKLRVAQRMAVAHRSFFNLPAVPHYEIFNDNRYEQHWYSWSG
ncbi:MAG TPA: glycosyltransferase [Stellaceae bacterium]|nr:glycosyltransferase [Stellaceae bacterium]